MVPFCYVKVYINIIKASYGLFTKMFFISLWFILGGGILSIFVIRDVINLIKIMLMHNGCQAYFKQEKIDEQDNPQQKQMVYNEMRDLIIGLYKKELHEIM